VLLCEISSHDTPCFVISPGSTRNSEITRLALGLFGLDSPIRARELCLGLDIIKLKWFFHCPPPLQYVVPLDLAHGPILSSLSVPYKSNFCTPYLTERQLDAPNFLRITK
jgi:hypothetical protein